MLSIPNLVGSSGPNKCSNYMHLPGGMENTYPGEDMPNTPHARLCPKECPTATRPSQCSLGRGETILHHYPHQGTYMVESVQIASRLD